MMSLCARGTSGERPKRYDIKFTIYTLVGRCSSVLFTQRHRIGTAYYRYIIIYLSTNVHHTIHIYARPLLYSTRRYIISYARREPSHV